MVEKDPRLQLYSASEQCLARLGQEFSESVLTEHFEWTNYFIRKTSATARGFDFTDIDSEINATGAKLWGIFENDANIYKITFDLFNRNESLVHNQTHVPVTKLIRYHSVVVSPDFPPTIFPFSEIYTYEEDGLQVLLNEHRAEVLGPYRCQQLINALGSLSIDQLDVLSLDLKKSQ
jgi:hypothetical protein